jgi:very-short-patch-repair endonuclease
MHLSPKAHELLRRQHGIAGSDQLEAIGYTGRQIRRLASVGALETTLRGAYRSPSVPFDQHARCVAVSIARPEVTVAGPTAGRLWGFRRLPKDGRIHVIGPPASNPAIAPWVVTYRTAAIHATDSVLRSDGIRVTSRQRTALDLTRWLNDGDLLSVIEQVLHDGAVSEADLLAVAADWLTPGRPWVRRFVRVLRQRLPGAPAESHPEVRVAAGLERLGVHGLVRQYRIDLPDYGAARFDLAVPHLRWAIEVDVHPRHDETAGRASDARRDACAHRVGWHTSRISRTEYFGDFAGALQRLHEEHQRRRKAQPAAS